MTLSGPPDLVVEGRRVVTPGGVRPARVSVADGVIRSVDPLDPDEPPRAPAGRRAAGTYDAGDAVVMPGLVDTHVHVNEPGRTAWEGFETATDAAAAGGVTTIVDMPLNSVPVTTDVEALAEKAASAEGRCRVDVGFWGGAVPGNAPRFAPLVEAGALGFKAFLAPSGIEEFQHLGTDDLREALEAVADLGVPLLVHAELEDFLGPTPTESSGPEEGPAGGPLPGDAPSADPRAYATYLATRPSGAEIEAISRLLREAAATGARVHVVHLSAANALGVVRRGRREGVPVSVETCPHYLTFSAGEIPDGATAFKCAPPIRDAENREALWRALGDGQIDLVASDHSPCPPELKDPDGGDFLEAWGGIASLQLTLPATWTEARRRGHGLTELARWTSAAPAGLAGLSDRKGAIEAGRDADLVVWDPDAKWTVRGEELQHRHPVTPYEDRTLRGKVRRTYLRGRPVYADGAFPRERTGRRLRGRGPESPADSEEPVDDEGRSP